MEFTSWLAVFVWLLPVSTATSASPSDTEGQRTVTGVALEDLHHYELVRPTRVDHEGHFLSYELTHSHRPQRRTRRSARDVANSTRDVANSTRDSDEISSHERIFYKLSAYGIDFHLNLTRNTRLVSPSFVVQYWNKGGVASQHNDVENCHYEGQIVNRERRSSVAISNCRGLHGVFATEDDHYVIEHLLNGGRAADGYDHIVYKKSAIKSKHNESHCGVEDPSGTTTHWWMSQSSLGDVHTTRARRHGNHQHKDKWRETPRRRSRRSVSKENTVELLVVVDKTMVGYHGSSEIEPYILTVMNIVANLYHDVSIGNYINIVVTRLVLLTEDQPHLRINHHADHSLKSFCEWQEGINPRRHSKWSLTRGIAHHDNAVLLTRYDICTYKNEPCGTLGLAPVAGMCESDRSCSINEDIGLASAFTIAHEMGHNFGMQHDGAGNNCGTPGHEGAKIMAAQLTKNTDPFSWSSCSRDYITSFLDAGRGKCLEETPSEEDFSYPDLLPGERHDGDAQCRYQYGSQSMQCRKEGVCRELWCLNPSDQCVTDNIPAASGTECSKEKIKKGWCLKGKCVKYHWRPKSTDGQWGAWSSWTECSRTCDGGVKVSERHCDSPRPTNGGKYCIGERKRYKSCHIEECPRKATDFRAEQCTRFDVIPFRGKYYKWKPYSGVGQLKPCALNCLADGYNFYTERAPKVIDGTRCYPDSVDMCINGECRHVGCDHLLGSDAIEDKCRVCGGDGSSCEAVTVTYDEPLSDKSGDSYVKVAVIPQGAMHIKVTEDVMSRNYLALKASVGDKYYINGAWTIDWPRKFEVASTVFHYERSSKKPESLTARGPTSEDLVLMLLLQEENKGVTYTYTMTTPNETVINVTEFVWQHTSWSECSASCAGGVTRSTAVCTRTDDRTIVQNDLCDATKRMSDLVKFCSKQACPPEWSIGAWSDCSVTCSGGVRMRTVMCLRKVGHRKSEVVKHTQCDGKRPKSRMRCNTKRCPTHWATDAWSNCHPKCGDAYKKRNVYCVSAEGRYMQESHCDATKRPPSRRRCQQLPCPPPSWVVGSWNKCSSRCGKGRQRRTVTCRTHRGRRSASCETDKKPATMRTCEGPCLRRQAEECKDVAKVTYCPLVLKFNFCRRSYFRQMCCKTCSKAGY